MLILAIKLGLVFSLVSFAVYLSLRIIDFPDMTVNGTFVLGAAISSICILNGISPMLALIAAFCVGSIPGIITAYLNIKVKIQNLLAGIIVMTGLYSVNLRVMVKPNISLGDAHTLFSNDNIVVLKLLLIVSVIWTCMVLFLLSEIGLGMRVSGQNNKVGEAYGVSSKSTITFILGLSNALVASSGALFSQLEGFADINMGNAIIIIGLVSVILGEQIVGKGSIGRAFFGCIVGAIAYKIIIAFALNTSLDGIQASDIFFITAALIVFLFMLQSKSG